jgi:hypothetical protein
MAYAEGNALLEVRMERPPLECDDDVGAGSIRLLMGWSANDAFRGRAPRDAREGPRSRRGPAETATQRDHEEAGVTGFLGRDREAGMVNGTSEALHGATTALSELSEGEIARINAVVADAA